MAARGTRATPANRGAEAASAYREYRRNAPRPVRHVVEIEDILLAAWVLLSETLVRRWFGEPGDLARTMAMQFGEGGWIAWLRALPLLGWLVVALFFFILLTRGPEDTDRDVALARRWPMLTFSLPLLSIYALIATGIQKLVFGLPTIPDGAQPPWPGPYVPGIVRRTAAIPLALLGDAIFRQQTIFAGLDVANGSAPLTLSPILVLPIFLSMLPFCIFVAGPRIAAGDVLAWRPWVIRFVLFYASVFASLVW
ncbi:MAG TPA: hypothetical protein VMF13_03985 [Luteitalea sp.]|nr:hypothetical protein [Luteitalea sp.]